jgi:hypothetical protein
MDIQSHEAAWDNLVGQLFHQTKRRRYGWAERIIQDFPTCAM